MDWNGLSDEDFRKEVIAFVEANCPAEDRYLPHRARWAESRRWYRILSEAGWLCPGWPTQYGGMGLSTPKQLIYAEELERLGTPRLMDQGIINVGPLLISHGTPEQRERYLPGILSGEQRWCQGFSEPGAGSDLAALRTEAVLEGDHYVINGQKTWTSTALDATHMFALVRTDKTVKKQAGITFILFDMDQPGVEVRPIVQLTGATEFCETFLTDVRARADDVVNGLNNGWRTAQALLGFERIFAGSPHVPAMNLKRLERAARLAGRQDDPVLRDRIAQYQMDVLDLVSTYERTAQVLREGGSFGVEVSVLKIWATETSARITETFLEVVGEAGGLANDAEMNGENLDLLNPFFEARSPMIYGGSVQIHRNMLAKAALKLPS